MIIAHHADKPLSLPWLGEQKDEFEALKLETGRRPPNAAPRGTSEHTENKPKERLRVILSDFSMLFYLKISN